MLKKLFYIICLLIGTAVMNSCQNEDFIFGTDSDKDIDNEEPIQFNFFLPATGVSRGFTDDIPVKTSFTNGDVIHIIGTFQTQALQEDGSYINGEVKRYGALQYNATTRNWTAVSGNKLTWPSIATSGSFEAYYVSGSNGLLTADNPIFQRSLSEITPMTDPLHSTEDDVVYGHAVELNFSHICTNLMLTEMQPMVSSVYFFNTEDVYENDMTTPREFNNGFQLKLESENNQPKLVFEFIQIPDSDYDGAIHIAGNAMVEQNIDGAGNVTSTGKVYYFLQPGYYPKFDITYPAQAPATYDYLSYDYNTIPDNIGGPDVENVKPNLMANTTYTLAITKSPGIIITAPSSEGGWDDDGDYHYVVDVEEFLKAVYNGSSYSEGDVDILEQTAEGTKLLRNLNFHNFNYSEFKDKGFNPNVQDSKVFDGDLHYIQNLGSPLFRYNYGTIKNIGIQDININGTSYEDSSQDFMNRHGALCMWNRQMATISNVRVSNLEMTINVRSTQTADSDGSETHNIGCVVGSNTGVVTTVALSGTMNLSVCPENGNDVNSKVLIGGISGQNAAEGNINDVSSLSAGLQINITNSCRGSLGSYTIGGIVGVSSGLISDVTLPNVTINSAESVGVTSYIGGMAGQLAVTDTQTSYMKSCIVGGSVTAGVTKVYEYITSENYIGGMAGVVMGVDISDCRSAVSVYGTGSTLSNVIYATGGGFGRIRPSSTGSFDDIIAYGSVLTAPQNSGASDIFNYVGNFAGLVPEGQTWQDDYAGHNILVHVFTSDYIGGNMN